MLLAGSANPEMRAQVSSLESWLRLRFSVNMPYDRMARELLTAEARQRPTSSAEANAAAFYQSADFKPELLAASTTRTVPRDSTAMRPVPRSSLCQLEATAVLADGGVL